METTEGRETLVEREHALVGDGFAAVRAELDVPPVRRRHRGWLIRRVLLAADVVGLAVAFLVAEVAFPNPAGFLAPGYEFLLFLATLPGWIVAAKLYGLYDRDEERTDHSTIDELTTLLHLITLGTWMLAVLSWVTGLANPEVPRLATFWLLALALVGAGRGAARAACRRTDSYLQNTVIVGTGQVGTLFARKILQHPEYRLNLLGFVDDDRMEPQDQAGLPLLGTIDELPALIEELDLHRVIVGYPEEVNGEVLELIYELHETDVQVDVVPRLFELIGTGVGIHTVEGLPLIGLPPFRLARSSHLLKRLMDLVLGGGGLLLLTPLFAVIAAAIKIDSRGPVFFRQVRRGSGETVFRVFKFRTMCADADEQKEDLLHLNRHLHTGDARMFKIEDDPRVTRVGRFLRRYSLDELPQLFNVLKGEMSLVGPRPLVLAEDQHVRRWARRRLHLKPGMTGLWQVLGASSIPFEDMVRLDYLYVTTWSLAEDVRLLLRTLPVVARGRHD